jgi:hypothetical protein
MRDGWLSLRLADGPPDTQHHRVEPDADEGGVEPIVPPKDGSERPHVSVVVHRA